MIDKASQPSPATDVDRPAPSRRRWLRLAFAGWLLLVFVVVLVVSRTPRETPVPPATGLAHAPLDLPPAGEVYTRPAPPAPRVATGEVDHFGLPVTVSCGTCHSTRRADLSTRRADQLDTFHQGLHYAHGDQSCASCHAANDYDALRLADGTRLPYEQVMQLCAQCHGPQYRDYRNGSHGGMAGHWDLAAGGRVRNNCIHCHDPHAPAVPKVQPVFAPNDRFLPSASHAHKDAHHE